MGNGILSRLQNFCFNTSALFMQYGERAYQKRMARQFGAWGMMNMYYPNAGTFNMQRSIWSNYGNMGGCTSFPQYNNYPGAYPSSNGAWGNFSDSLYGQRNSGIQDMNLYAQNANQQIGKLYSDNTDLAALTKPKNGTTGSSTGNSSVTGNANNGTNATGTGVGTTPTTPTTPTPPTTVTPTVPSADVAGATDTPNPTDPNTPPASA